MEQVKIVPSILRQQVEEGKKLKELVEFYNLPEASMKKALKALDLKIKKTQKPKFVFVEEDSSDTVINNSEEINENKINEEFEYQKENI